MASDGAQAELGDGDDGIHLRLLDSTDQFPAARDFPELDLPAAAVPEEILARAGVWVGPGQGTELLRRLWRAVVWWSGGSTVAQGICSGAEGVAVVLELGNGGYGEDRAQRRAAGAN